jgi:acetate kinase
VSVLVLNCGSSSLKACVVDVSTGARLASHTVERIGAGGPAIHESAVAQALEVLPGTFSAVGHRVVHGGEAFVHPTRVDGTMLTALDALVPLAPLHLPANLLGMRAALARLPDLPHVAVFDTAFHHTLPRRAQQYALPAELVQKHGLRRYGFHGTSHAWVAQRAADALQLPIRQLRLITCHLGSGASVTAVEFGRSVETSMGMTPLEGLVMGTRSGDVDAGLILDLARKEGLSIEGLEALLNQKSGLLGMSGSSDMRDIEARAGEGDKGCQQALQAFAHRLRKYIGAYAAVMGGVDAIVFTGGIGENSAEVRHRAAQRLDLFGAVFDEDLNRDARVSFEAPVASISAPHSRCQLLVVKTDEERAIAEHTAEVVAQARVIDGPKGIPIAISARHIHLTQEAVTTLFGPGRMLTPRNPLSQPAQFACEETLTVVGPKGRIERVRVLGPVRSACQVEVSRTDEFALGLDAPIRCSGDVAGSAGVALEGPAGRLTLNEGVIQAQRHIHMTPADAETYGVSDKDVVEVRVESNGRSLVFGDVVVRVSSKFSLEMHIDTDEANAAEIVRGAEGMLVITSGKATLLQRTS